MPQPESFFSKAGDVLKLASVVAIVLGLAQLGCYTWFYGIPFPFSLGNLAIVGSLSIVIGIVVVICTIIPYLLSQLDVIREWFTGLEEDTQGLLMFVGTLVLLIGALLPVTTSYALRHVGIGGGLKVVYFLAKDTAVPTDLLSSPDSRMTKPLFLVIDGGDMVYVRPDWKKREGFIGIQKSQINAVQVAQ